MTTGQLQQPSPLDPTALIDSADHAVNNAPPIGPSREAIHRAISTAYYAVFHAISAVNADARHGVPTNRTTAQAWTHTYRQMRHGSATKRLSQYLFSLTQDARLLANGFINLKTARETADYDPNRVMTVGDANFWIGQARAALIAMQAMTAADRQTFSNITLTGNP